MTEDDDKPNPETCGCVLDAADLRGRDDIAGYSYNEKFAEALVEDQLDRDA